MKSNPISECKDTNLFANCKTNDAEIDLNFFFTRSGLLVEGWDDTATEGAVTLYVRSRDKEGTCPYCHHSSGKVHSRYVRHLLDLPAFGKRTVLCFHVRKFFCLNEACGHRTFAEQPGSEVFRYRRRTRRCEVSVCRHGLGMSSVQASRLLGTIGIPVSGPTVLRDLNRMTVPEESDVRRIGIDDWAFKKGSEYGSMIVDLASSRVIDLLPGRTEDCFSEWLSRHKSVWLLSRDRATSYSSAAAGCGFPVTEIADRFHLMKNLGECVTDAVASRHAEICLMFRQKEGVAVTRRNDYAAKRFSEVKRLQAEGASVARTMSELGMSRRTVQKYRKMGDVSELGEDRRKKAYVNEERFNEVKRLQAEGRSVAETMSALGMSECTVKKYRAADSFPVPQRRSGARYRPHADYVERQYARGVSMDRIHKDLAAKGFKFSRSGFHAHFRYLSDGHRGYRPKAQIAMMEEASQDGMEPTVRDAHVPSVREVARVAMKSVLDRELSAEEGGILDVLLKMKWFAELLEAARSFRRNLRSRCPSRMEAWVKKHQESDINRIQTFVNGLKRDFEAVRNAMLFRESNGILEGYVNKLKAVKRSMYGKANLHLLKVKMVMPAFTFN